MTQTNTSTARVRNIKNIANDHIWKYNKNNLQKWESFSLQDSLRIEIMYISQHHGPIMIKGQMYSYDFDNMTQRNNCNFNTTAIMRSRPLVKTDNKQKVGKSRILISGLAADMTTAKEKLDICVRSLGVVNCIDVQSKLVPILDEHVNRIQSDYRVEIHSWPNDSASTSDIKAKHKVIGYIQELCAKIYQ